MPNTEKKPSKKVSRRGEREMAFQTLYALCFTPAASRRDLARAFAALPGTAEPGGQNPQKPEGFAWELVEGVWEKQAQIDADLSKLSQNWRIERIGKVELTILRLAVYELLYRLDVPPKVAINEAVELSKQFGDDNSRSFVNGILDAAAKALDSGIMARPASAMNQ